MTIPNPTASLFAWWPATVQRPEGDPIHRARVYVTPEGLYVYTRVPADGVTPNHYWPVNWGATAQPVRTTATQMNGFKITTDVGLVTIHAYGQGCGCGHPLKRWSPEFAGNAVKGWPSAGAES
jgi:hypothetical protein